MSEQEGSLKDPEAYYNAVPLGTAGKMTLVTGVIDIGRGSYWKMRNSMSRREFSFYLTGLRDIMKIDMPMVIHIQKKYEEVVWKARDKNNTKVVITEINDIRGFPYYKEVQKIRKSRQWLSPTAQWLQDSCQCRLPDYNPLVMSKPFWLCRESKADPFNTQYFIWLDAGIVQYLKSRLPYPVDAHLLENLALYLDKFFFLAYPFYTHTEIQGFERNACARYSQTDFVDRICRGGLVGGDKQHIERVVRLYDGMLADTLRNGYMGTEESIYTILSYRYPELFHLEMIEDGNKVYPFFARLAEGAPA